MQIVSLGRQSAWNVRAYFLKKKKKKKKKKKQKKKKKKKKKIRSVLSVKISFHTFNSLQPVVIMTAFITF